MSLYDIITVPDPVLKEKAQPVSAVDADVQKQMDRMLETMYAAPGIGLAANQVNILNRVIVMDVDPNSWVYGPESDGVLTIKTGYRSGQEQPVERKKQPLLMANPEVVWASDAKSVYEEGCLSIPQQYGDVIRPARVRVKYLDREGKENEIEAEGLLSHCVQHEIDHLNGILFIDYLSSLKRSMILRKVEKSKKQELL